MPARRRMPSKYRSSGPADCRSLHFLSEGLNPQPVLHPTRDRGIEPDRYEQDDARDDPDGEGIDAEKVEAVPNEVGEQRTNDRSPDRGLSAEETGTPKYDCRDDFEFHRQAGVARPVVNTNGEDVARHCSEHTRYHIDP